MEIFYKPIIASLIFSALGIVILFIAYFIIEKLTPENTWHEISKNNNIALAIVFALVYHRHFHHHQRGHPWVKSFLVLKSCCSLLFLP